MADKGTSKTAKPSSTSLRKAINQNKNIDKELKKELKNLDVKKKSSEKAFDHKKTQFLRHRLRNKPRNHSPDRVKSKTGTNGLQDFGLSCSTGNLLEALRHTSRTQSPLIRRQLWNEDKLHKLSLDSRHRCSSGDNDDRKHLVCLSSGKTMAKSLSWGEDLSIKEPQDDYSIEHTKNGLQNISSTNLDLPLLPKYLSRSDEALHNRVENKNYSRNIQSDQQLRDKISNYKSNNLMVPLHDKRLSQSDDCLAKNVRLFTTNCSTECKIPVIERRHCSETVRPTNGQKGRSKDYNLATRPLTANCCPESKVQQMERNHSYSLSTGYNKSLSKDSYLASPTRPVTANCCSEIKAPLIEKQHCFYSEAYKSMDGQTAGRPKDNHLSLPPLSRQRSKSWDSAVSVVKQDQQQLAQAMVSIETNSPSEGLPHPRQPRPPLSPRSARVKLSKDPRKVSSFGETTREERRVSKEEKGPKGGKLPRSSSTPDLSDIGPEVEYLLMDDVSK